MSLRSWGISRKLQPSRRKVEFYFYLMLCCVCIFLACFLFCIICTCICYFPHPCIYFAELCDYVVVWLQAVYASELQPIWELFNEALWFIQFWGVIYICFFSSRYFFLQPVLVIPLFSRSHFRTRKKLLKRKADSVPNISTLSQT